MQPQYTRRTRSADYELTQQLLEAFWLNVTQTSTCWLWEGPTNFDNHGYITIPHHGTEGVHRISWRLHCGAIPVGMHVLHRCEGLVDFPNCVNPFHLYLGTHKDNMADIARRNQELLLRPGAGWFDVLAIRYDYATGLYTKGALARRYNIDAGTVSAIVRGIIWKHILFPESLFPK